MFINPRLYLQPGIPRLRFSFRKSRKVEKTLLDHVIFPWCLIAGDNVPNVPKPNPQAAV